MTSHVQTFDPEGDVTLVLYDGETGDIVARRETRMRVSSKHLRLASQVFSAMLSERFQEGQELLNMGSVTIPLPEDCPHSFAILMTLVHAKYNLLPKSVSLEALTSLAVIVDKYLVHDSVGPLIIDQWIKEMLKDSTALECLHAFPNPCFIISSGVNNDLLMQCIIKWIAIAWVFRREELFMTYAKLAILNSTNNITSILPKDFLDNFPIPQKIIGEFKIQGSSSFIANFGDGINHRRLMHLEGIFHELSEAVEWLMCLRNNICKAPIPYLRENCRTTSLASFTNNPAIQGLLPAPKIPYEGLSLCNLKPKLERIHVETFCGDGAHMSYLRNGKGGWGYFAAFAEEICREEKGLSFQDFL